MNQTTSARTAKMFHRVSPTTSAIRRKVQQIDAETTHQIYTRLLALLQNKRIKVKKTDMVLPFILHPKTKEALQSEQGFSGEQIDELEKQITDNAECFSDYKVLYDAPEALHYALDETDETNLIFKNQIVSLPNAILNALICGELQKEFGRKVLLSCDGFIEVRAADDIGIIHKTVRLDIDGWIIRRGFMAPIYRNGKIIALKIYRHPKDLRPFTLRSRIGGLKW